MALLVAAGRSPQVMMVKGALQLQYHACEPWRWPTASFPTAARALQLHLQMVMEAAPCSDAGLESRLRQRCPSGFTGCSAWGFALLAGCQLGLNDVCYGSSPLIKEAVAAFVQSCRDVR